MNLNFQAGGSPLEARGNIIIYGVLIVAGLVIGVFFMLWLWRNIQNKKKEDPKWIETQKNRPTRNSDVRETCQKYNLSAEQGGILLWLCKTFQIPNIYYTIRDFSSIEDCFRQGYKTIKETWQPSRINKFFVLRFDVEKISAMSTPTSSTNSLPVNHKMTLVLENGTTTQCTISESTKDNLSLVISKDFFESGEKPTELSKVAFSFVSPSGLPYVFVTRVTRYQVDSKGQNILIIPQSTNLIAKSQRHYKRLNTNEKCRIASVSVKEKSKNNSKKIFVESEKKVECTLLNISGGGCCINTTLPIKEGQKIFVEIKLNGEDCSAIGKIIKTRKSKTPCTYNLHVQFIQVSVEVQNLIYEKVYGYNQ